MQVKKKKCKECRKSFQPFNSMTKACSVKCALALVSKEKERKFNAETRKLKDKIKTLNELLSEAQDAFNKYIRIRDQGKPCPSCGRSEDEIIAAQGWKTGGAFDAGHYRSRGAASQLRFNLIQVWRECKSCNGGGGKYSHKDHTKTQRYRATLVERLGEERVAQIDNDNRQSRYTKEYARRVKRIFSRRARIYKKLFRE